MLIGTAIIEAGSTSFNEFHWGEDLVKVVNSLMEKENQISLETTGHELEEILGKLGKYASRAIEKYPIYEPNIGVSRLVLKLIQTVGNKNAALIGLGVFLTIIAALFAIVEAYMLAIGTSKGTDHSYLFKIIESLIEVVQSVV